MENSQGIGGGKEGWWIYYKVQYFYSTILRYYNKNNGYHKNGLIT